MGSTIPDTERIFTPRRLGVIGGIDELMWRHRSIFVDCHQINDTLNRFSVQVEQDFENLDL